MRSVRQAGLITYLFYLINFDKKNVFRNSPLCRKAPAKNVVPAKAAQLRRQTGVRYSQSGGGFYRKSGNREPDIGENNTQMKRTRRHETTAVFVAVFLHAPTYMVKALDAQPKNSLTIVQATKWFRSDIRNHHSSKQYSAQTEHAPRAKFTAQPSHSIPPAIYLNERHRSRGGGGSSASFRASFDLPKKTKNRKRI